MILRDGIAPLGGKYVASEPLTPSEHRERPFFRLRTFFPDTYRIRPGSGRDTKITKISIFRMKIRFYLSSRVFKTILKTEYAGVSTFSELLFFVGFWGSRFRESSAKVPQSFEARNSRKIMKFAQKSSKSQIS